MSCDNMPENGHVMRNVVCAYARMNGPRWAGLIVRGYVELIRNTPLLIQIFIVYFGLSSVGLKLSAEISAVTSARVAMASTSRSRMRTPELRNASSR